MVSNPESTACMRAQRPARFPYALTLVLDDDHVITESTTDEAVATLIEQA